MFSLVVCQAFQVAKQARLFANTVKFVWRNYNQVELVLIEKYGKPDRSNPGIVGWQNGQDAIALMKNGTAKDSVLTFGNGQLTVLHETRKRELAGAKSPGRYVGL